MNVLQLIHSNTGFYGAERVVVTLCVALQELNINPTIGVFVDPAKSNHVELLHQVERLGLRTEAIQCCSRFDRRAISRIRHLLKSYSVDVMHSHGVKPNLYAYAAARNNGVPLVSTCHTWHINSLKDWAISALDRTVLRGFERIVLVSDHMKPQVRRFGLQARLIYNGIHLEPFSTLTADVRSEMGWANRPTIGAIARLAPEKGLSYLLRAAALVLKDNPQPVFVIVGEGPERHRLKAEAKALGICDSVLFLGARADVPQLLGSMDILAMPSLSEGMPMALLEAMASAKAVVASRVGAIPHVIQDHTNGVLVNPRDITGLASTLKVLIQDSALRAALGKQARQTIEGRFSAEAMALEYARLYGEMKPGNTMNSRYEIPERDLQP